MISYILIGITVLVSMLAFQQYSWMEKLKMNPYAVIQYKQYGRILSHIFVHADYMHLGVNMFVLWQFGPTVESAFEDLFGGVGSFYYVFLYFGGAAVASLPSLKNHSNNPSYSAVGASGAIASVLFSYILMLPTSMLGIMLVIPMPAFLFGVLYLWYESKMQGKQDLIAHDAHLFGAIFGFVASIAFEPKLILWFVKQVSAFFLNFF
jgi:membrane associated rhomboid family serine protease